MALLWCITNLSNVNNNTLLKSSNTDEWSAFGAGYSVGILTSRLLTSPTKTPILSHLAADTLSNLSAHVSSDKASFNSSLGVWLGLAHADTEDIQLATFREKAIENIRTFVTN